jgi:hypothetical protein
MRILLHRKKTIKSDIPPAGIEPAIFAVRGQCPKPLDDEGKELLIILINI